MNTCLQERVSDTEQWPAEVKFMLSVLAERPTSAAAERRSDARCVYRKRASLHLLDGSGNTWRVAPIYTRDVNGTGLGLLCDTELPVGARAVLHLPSPGGRTWYISCSVVRCFRFIDNWFEGAVYFDQEQAALRPQQVA